MVVRTLLFTDVVDSTLLVERVGDERAAEVWAEHDRCARALLASHRGREIDRTDGFFLLFDEVVDAAAFALGYHRALTALALRARVGLHVGPVTLRENTPDDVSRGAKSIEVEGLAKPFAARVMALAAGGQTLLSASAQAALGAALPEGSETESHGHYRLKGVEEPVELFELGLRTDAAFEPPADADKAYRVVRDGELWRPLREVRHNLPAERDAFVGRSTELRALAQRLDASTRLVTVVGAGGTGKTRLVRRYGQAWLGDWPGGIYFCDLSEARSLEGICFAVAVALNVPLGKAEPIVQLGHAIASRGRCLIVLDNFEQVIAHASVTVGAWLDRAADAAIIVTSRERLHLQGETVLPLEPLPVAREAVELFALRAKAQKPDFELNAANRAAVERIAMLLDGLPLAIELAAARVRVLSPAQIVERMRDRFKLLAGARGTAARQATLRAAIDWSWDLLAPWEQAAMAQCSVFEGGFTMEAAEAVLDLSAWPDAPPAMDAVQALVDKSLLRTWTTGRYDIDEPYFGMYVSVRAYARDRLDASPSPATLAAEQRHGAFFARFGADEALESLCRHGSAVQHRLLRSELDNLVSACRRAVLRSDGVTAVATFRAVWEVAELHGPFTLATELGTQVVAMSGLEPPMAAAARWALGAACWRSGRFAQAEALLAEALAMAQGCGDRSRVAGIIGSQGNLYNSQGRPIEERAAQEAALAIYRSLGARRNEGTTLGNLGNLHFMQGALDEARTVYEQAIEIHREVGHRLVEGSMWGNLAGVHHAQGRCDEARLCCEQALAIHRELDDRRSEGVALGNIGLLLQDEGRLAEAREHFETALAMHRDLGDRRMECGVLVNLGLLHRDEGRLDEAYRAHDAALTIARETGIRNYQGVCLGSLGDILLRQGKLDSARNVLRDGESFLRDNGDRLDLAKLLCIRGQADAAAGDIESARAALAEAEAAASATGAGPGSELRRLADELQHRLR